MLILSFSQCHFHGWGHDHHTVELQILLDGKKALIQNTFPGSVLPGFEREVETEKDAKVWKQKTTDFESNVGKYIQFLPSMDCKFSLSEWNRKKDGHHLDTVVNVELDCPQDIEGFTFHYSAIEGIENIALEFPDNPSYNKKYKKNNLEWKKVN